MRVAAIVSRVSVAASVWMAAPGPLLVLGGCGTDVDVSDEPSTGASGGAAGSASVGGMGGSVGATPSPGTCVPDDVDPATAKLPCDVESVLVDRCQRCHRSPDALAECLDAGSCVRGPFPLVTWADTRRPVGDRAVFERIGAVVNSGFMPLQTDAVTPPIEPLTEAEKHLILGWVADCAPPGAEVCAAP